MAKTEGNGSLTEYPICGSLHIWYTSIRAAQDAKMGWSPLEFEYDPCSDPPPTLMLHREEIEGNVMSLFRNHEPFVNLVEVNQNTISNGVISNGVIQGIVDLAQAY